MVIQDYFTYKKINMHRKKLVGYFYSFLCKFYMSVLFLNQATEKKTRKLHLKDDIINEIDNCYQ